MWVDLVVECGSKLLEWVDPELNLRLGHCETSRQGSILGVKSLYRCIGDKLFYLI